MKCSKLVKLYLFSLVLLLSPSLALAEELTIVTGEWAPYMGKELPGNGFLNEIVTKAYAEVGINVNFVYMPWKRVSELEVGRYNAISSAWVWNKEREKKWRLSEKITQGEDILVTHKNSNISWKTLGDLKPYHLGTTLGYSYGDEFDRFKTQLMIESVPSDIINLKKVLAGRIDAFVVNRMVAASLIRSYFTPEQRKEFKFVVDPLIGQRSLHLVCSKTYKKCSGYLAKFNQGLRLITDNGAKRRIVDQAASME